MLSLSLLFLDVMLQSISSHNINLYAKTNETFFLIFTTRAHIYTFDLDLSPTLCISVNS